MPVYKKVNLGIRTLSSENFSSVCRSTLTLMLQNEQALNADQRLKKATQKFQASQNAFDNFVKTGKATDGDTLTSLDKQRDFDINDFKTYLKLKARHRNEEIRKAAEKLYLLLMTYGNLTKRTHAEQTTLIVQLLKQLDTKENRALISKIGAAEFVTHIKESNNAFEAAYLKKFEGNPANATPTRTELRKALEDDYNNIYAYLLSLEHFGQDTFHKPLLAAFNQVRKEFVGKQKKPKKD